MHSKQTYQVKCFILPMRIPHRTSAKLISVLAVLSLLVVSSAVVMAQDQSAPLPTWTKGQTWAIGGDKDLSSVLGDNLGSLQDTLALLGNIKIDSLHVTGTSGAWAVFKVKDVTADTYLLEHSTGMCVHANVYVSVHGELPSAGVQDMSNMTKENKAISVNACLDLMITSHGVATIDKATMAVISDNSTSVVDESLVFKAVNFPNISTEMSIKGTTMNTTYQNSSINECLHLELASNVSFSPALNLMKFPLSVGDNWTIDSKMMFTGQAKGYFNATGVSPSSMSGLIEKNGAFNGSVRVQDLTKLGPLPINNGTIGPVDLNVNAMMECVGTKMINDCCGNITVFDVTEKQSGVHLFYSPNTSFFASFMMKPNLSSLGGMITLPAGGMTSMLNMNTSMSIASADPTNATKEIATIGASQGVQTVSLVPPAETGSGATGQDSTMMVLLVVAIAAIGACVGGVLLLRNKSKKSP
jgi:hypothetical protein